MNISFDNRALIENSIEIAYIKALTGTGSDVSVTIDDNNGLAQNDFVVAGALMMPKSEIAMINSSVTAGTAIQLDSLTFPHNPNDKLVKIAYNQVKLYHATTLTGSKTLIETKDIDVDQKYTDFVVADSATGYYFFSLYNSQSTTESDYSPGILATEHTNKTRSSIKKFVEVFYKDDLDDEELQLVIDAVVDQIYAIRAWKFREGTATFTTTTGVYTYDIEDDIGIDDFGRLLSIRTATQILDIIGSMEDDILSLNPLVLMPHTVFEWAGSLHIRIPTAEEVTIKYYKNTESLITAGTKTAIKLVTCIGFGVLELLYIPKDAKMSEKFRSKFNESLRIMRKDDEKNFEFATLAEQPTRRSRQDTTPTIT